ncbi:MAG: alkaline phosphatase family protein [Marinifilaceae bacterium]
MLRSLLVSSLLILPFFASAQGNQSPKAVIVITVNQFYPEWMQQFSEYASHGGFKRLNAGTKINADYNYYFLQRGVDQASLLTGSYPSKHGIAQLGGYSYLQRKCVDDFIDTRYTTLSGDQTSDGVSPKALQLITLGGAMKMQNSFSKAYSIATNKEEALLSAGAGSNNAIWLDEDTGNWTSSSFYGDNVDMWLKSYNSKQNRDSILRMGWMPMAAESQKSGSIRIVGKLANTDYFFYDLQKAQKNYNTYRVLKATPHVNTMTLNLAKHLIKEQAIGKDNDPDLLTISLSSLDYMNRDFVIGAPEFRDLVVRMDRDLNHFLSFLDNEIGKDNYTLLFTYAQPRELLPEDLQPMRMPSDYFSMFKAMALLKSYLNLIYGEGDWIAHYNAAQIYLNRELIASRKISLGDIQSQIAQFLNDFEGIDRVITSTSLIETGVTGTTENKVRNSFYRKKSGDIFVCMSPYWAFENNHNIPNQQEYSRRNIVPLYVIGHAHNRFSAKKCKVTDIMPTLCDLLNISTPYQAEGESFLK